MVKHITITVALVLISNSVGIACAPAPSCWMKSDKAYLRSVCQSYKGQGQKQISQYVEEPEKVPEFAKACKQFGINFK
jgi:hypothetical protein